MRSCRCIVAQPVATTRLVGVGIAAMMFHIFVLPRMSPACCLGTGYQMCQQGVFKPCIDFTDGDQSGCELSQNFKARVDRSLGVVSLQCCDVVICLEQVSCIPQTWKHYVLFWFCCELSCAWMVQDVCDGTKLHPLLLARLFAGLPDTLPRR